MYDIDTIGGMNRAVEWTRENFEKVKDGGVWIIPRSGTIVTIHHAKRLATINSGFIPDTSIERVIRAMGWKVEHETNGESNG